MSDPLQLSSDMSPDDDLSLYEDVLDDVSLVEKNGPSFETLTIAELLLLFVRQPLETWRKLVDLVGVRQQTSQSDVSTDKMNSDESDAAAMSTTLVSEFTSVDVSESYEPVTQNDHSFTPHVRQLDQELESDTALPPYLDFSADVPEQSDDR